MDIDKVSGVVKIVGDTQLPREFITVGKDFEEALGRTVINDQNELNDVVAYKAQLMEFQMYEELADLTSWLNGKPAIGGYNRLQALMSHIGILSEKASGVRLSKEGGQSLKEIKEATMRARRRESDEETPS